MHHHQFSVQPLFCLTAEELHQTHEKELIKKDEEIQNVLAEFADFKREKQSELVALKIEVRHLYFLNM